MVTFEVLTWFLITVIGVLAIFVFIFCAMTCHYIWCIRELLAGMAHEPAPTESETDVSGVPQFMQL
jgi:hypothetical protein